MTSVYDRVERRVDPPDADDARALASLVVPRRDGDAFPRSALEGLLRGSVGRHITPAEHGGELVWDRLMRLCARMAEADLELTLGLGGVVLGALPVIVAGDEAQRRRFFATLRSGGLAGLALSEWDRGSDLLSSDTVAEALEGGGWRISGEKRPTNNGNAAAWLTVLARTGDVGDPFGATLFLVPRDAPGLAQVDPVAWPCAPAMDLSGARFEGVEVGPEGLLGKVGDGFGATRRVLEISRSGVACMAAGAQASALAAGWRHAHERRLYGAPIAELDAVRGLLCSSFARLVLATSLSRFAARAVGRWGPGARPWSCAA